MEACEYVSADHTAKADPVDESLHSNKEGKSEKRKLRDFVKDNPQYRFEKSRSEVQTPPLC